MGTLVKSDLVATVSKLQELQAAWTPSFDAAFIEMCGITGQPKVDFSTSTVVSTVHSTLQQAGSTITATQVQTAFSVLMPTSQLAQQWSQVSQNGLTSTLTAVQTHLSNTITAMDDEGGDDGGDDGGLGDPGDPGEGDGSGTGAQSQFCQVLNFVAAAIGTAAFTLSLGCLPDNPFFVMICGAILVLGIIAGLIAIIAWIAC